MPTRVAKNTYSYAGNDNVFNYKSIPDAIGAIEYDHQNPSNTEATPSGNMITDLRGIFGIPYQFLETVDPRIYDSKGNKTSIGAKYGEKIVAKMPLLFLTPCRQKFMAGYDDNERSVFLSGLLSDNGLDSALLNTALSHNGRYYTSVFEWASYYKYVNTLCNIMASYMGIDRVRIPTNNGRKQIGNINWANDLSNDIFSKYFNTQNAVIFYLDGQSVTEMSESFSNTTAESSLASQLNGYSDQVNEIKFLLGENSGLLNMTEEAGKLVSDGIISNLGDAFSGLTGKMISDLGKTGVSTLLAGGKLVFPRLWSDSTFSRSYSFSIKLRSPDHDNLSIFLNIMVPYIHILALTLPIAHEDNANSYNAPFLVKGYCKGLFNINDGIISDLSVTRGAECQWNDDGLPTQMDLQISIEDLYSSLFMSAIGATDQNANPVTNILQEFNVIQKLKDSVSVVQNTAMMDYLANLAGFNLADEEMLRSVKMLMKLTDNTFTQAGNDIYNRFDREIANMIKKLYF